MSWIELNIPYRLHNYYDPRNYPPFPHDIVNEKVRDHFFVDFDEVSDEFESKNGKSYFKYLELAENKVRKNLTNTDELCDREMDALVEEELKKSSDPIIQHALHIEELYYNIIKYKETLPEILEWNKECNKIDDEYDIKESVTVFTNSTYNKVGVLIEVKDSSGIVSRYLIGSEPLDLSSSHIVLRAKVLIEDINAIE